MSTLAKSFISSAATRRQEQTETLAFLNDKLGSTGWFIAGSYAHPDIEYPSDVDVFFTTEAGFNSAETIIDTVVHNSKYNPAPYVSPDATTYHIAQSAMRLQLIKKHFGTVDQILSGFDLNACKRAIMPNGTVITHPTADQSLHIAKVNAGTFKRYFKYINYLKLKNEIPERGRELIDKYIKDDRYIEEYYDGKDISTTVNKSLLKVVSQFHSLKPYAHQQALIHAPELLI